LEAAALAEQQAQMLAYKAAIPYLVPLPQPAAEVDRLAVMLAQALRQVALAVEAEAAAAVLLAKKLEQPEIRRAHLHPKVITVATDTLQDKVILAVAVAARQQ
jgi:hypothetical protein